MKVTSRVRESRSEEILGFTEEDRARAKGRGPFLTRTVFDLLASAARMRWRRRPRWARTPRSRSSTTISPGASQRRATPRERGHRSHSPRHRPRHRDLRVVDSVLLEPFPTRSPTALLPQRLTETARARATAAVTSRVLERDPGVRGAGRVMSIRQNLTGVEIPLQVQVWKSWNLFACSASHRSSARASPRTLPALSF
jgi:hypothetical protein